MKERGQFDRHDLEKMAKAKSLLIEVYEYNYGASGMSRKIARLETILAKLETLENME